MKIAMPAGMPPALNLQAAHAGGLGHECTLQMAVLACTLSDRESGTSVGNEPNPSRCEGIGFSTAIASEADTGEKDISVSLADQE